MYTDHDFGFGLVQRWKESKQEVALGRSSVEVYRVRQHRHVEELAFYRMSNLFVDPAGQLRRENDWGFSIANSTLILECEPTEAWQSTPAPSSLDGLKAGFTFAPLPEGGIQDETPTLFVGRDIWYNLFHSIADIINAFLIQYIYSFEQIVLLDDWPDGPSIPLWELLVQGRVLRFRDLSGPRIFSTCAFSATGMTSLLWNDFWTDQPACRSVSPLVQAFQRYVLAGFGIERRNSENRKKITVIQRSPPHSRRIANLQVVLETLAASAKSAEIRCIDFSELTLHDQIRLAHHSDVLVGVHGAGLTHILWMQPGTTVVELCPNSYYTNAACYGNLAAWVDVRHAHWLHTPTPEEESARDALDAFTVEAKPFVQWFKQYGALLEKNSDSEQSDLIFTKVNRQPEVSNRSSVVLDTKQLQSYQQLSRQVIATMPDYPGDNFSGRGIVICAGGEKYFPPAWVCVNMLRRMGCRLPVEFWYLGPYEMDGHMRKLVEPLGVRCVDAYEVCQLYPVRHLGGWEIKPFSILYSRFAEVILLDADNVPLIDPSIFFETQAYQETGAIFWPDYHPISRQNPIWEVCEVPYAYEPSFESGQIVVDKRRCWSALQLTMHYNEHSDLYYRLLGGDKDTFHLAWRRLGQLYTMIPFDVQDVDRCAMAQHDFSGRRVFLHRHLAKWHRELEANPHLRDFPCEAECLGFLSELSAQWDGRIEISTADSPEGRELMDWVISKRLYVYHRVGYDRRILELQADQTIGRGSAGLERTWHIEHIPKLAPALCLNSSNQMTCRLWLDEHGIFKGHWLRFERMPIELIPVELIDKEEFLQLETAALRQLLEGQRFVAVEVQHTHYTISLERDEKLYRDSREDGRWYVTRKEEQMIIVLWPKELHQVQLYADADGVWRGVMTGRGHDFHLVPIPSGNHSM